jgi:hypothetical protein
MRHERFGKLLREFARIFFQGTRQLHGDIACEIAVRWIAWSLQCDVGKYKLGAGKYRRCDFGKKCSDLLFVSGMHGREIG